MADITEKTKNSELVTNRDRFAVVENIEFLIKVIRGQQVMIDRDLATLYGVETKRLNEQVKRNIKRFPEDFMFQLTKEECLRSQIATLNEGRGQHLKYMPCVFTENGVAMLSSVLRSELSREECLRSQIVTSNGRGGNRYSTYAFTEQGVAMLSSVLRSQTAIEVNIQIMRTFVSMRHFIVNSASVFCRLETIEYHQLEIQQHQQ